ncbi:hypothetical protein QYE76_020430 [Lolium multiflorum]|uniref:Integrase catalytic domain-containing protein n=1 Tax=Lolium multiflorum TaxID=4521 RepID=A0AAD8VS66_LOLMU|nr:hypothetical protein QYE76_020430 [Lolium multiflorum]
MEDQRCNIFQTRAGIGGKSIKVIIDGGSCHNLASTELCEKLNLTLHPYHVQWLSDKGNVKIQHTVTVNFKIGPYEDTVECDVVPMTVCHMLLGRPWQFDKKAIHDGYSNAYTFKEFQDVFPDELPHGLPPLRGIEHRIDLIPGAPLPNRAAYRTNPEDTKEINAKYKTSSLKASIVSDRDVKFMSYLWKSLMAKFGVKLLFSSSSHPQTDGQTEVVNRSLSTLLRTLVKTNLKSWEDCLPHAEFAYNRAKHYTTSRSPFMIVYGFEPPTALDILPLPLHERTNMDFDERTTAMKKLHEETRATIQEHVLRQANRLNAKKKERVFEEGDLVWIHLRKERFPQERNSKLKPRGDGPFKVLKRINNNAYVIDIPTSKYLIPLWMECYLMPKPFVSLGWSIKIMERTVRHGQGKERSSDREDVHGAGPKSPQNARKRRWRPDQNPVDRPLTGPPGSNPVDRPPSHPVPNRATNRCHPDDFPGLQNLARLLPGPGSGHRPDDPVPGPVQPASDLQ